MVKIAKLCCVYLMVFISGCTTIVSSVRDEPIKLDPYERTWGSWMDDQAIETVVAVNIQKADLRFENSRIEVICFNGTLLLVGQVPAAELKTIASEEAKKVHQVKKVYNELTVGPATTLLEQSGDALLTLKIKTAFISSDALVADRIKVNTDGGTVYLMGIVTSEEAQAAVDIVRNTQGVRKIVKVFEYISLKVEE